MEQILDGILEAIEDEIRSQKHYKELAEKAEDPKVKKFFQQLVLEEKNHEKILKSRYQALKKIAKIQEEE